MEEPMIYSDQEPLDYDQTSVSIGMDTETAKSANIANNYESLILPSNESLTRLVVRVANLKQATQFACLVDCLINYL